MATQTLKNWHKVRLDEIANFEYGYTASAKENDTGTKLLRITDIVPDLIDWNTVPFCEIDEKGVRQFEIKKGDILIARTGATAGYAKLIRRQPQKSVFASYLIRVRMKKADVSPEYVGRIVESEMFKQFVTIHAGGSAQPHANAPVLKNFELFLPDAKTQTEIVDVLSAYDDLIENNTRRIQILEQLAQAIYTEWFVKFRFPGYEKVKMIDSDTDFGKIPEGWEVAKVGDIAEFMNGYAFKPRHLGMIGLPVIKIPELRSGVLSKTPRNSGESIPKKYFIKNGDILFSWSATLLVNIWNSGEGLLNQHLFKVTPKADYLYSFIFYFLANQIEKYRSHAVGATMQHLRRDVVINANVLLPNKDLLIKFENIVLDILKERSILIIENQNLRQTRDLLLPKLVTGEIRV